MSAMGDPKHGETPESGEERGPNDGVHFIRAMIAADNESGKFDRRVVTRFPPEPNGYLHIGHAKSICLNFTMALEHDGGRCHLRFDDTNPTTEDAEYVRAIEQDVRWLGFEWGEHEYFASSYFDRLYEYAIELIEAGKAYVDSLDEAEIREYRGTLSTAGRPSPHRERSVAENLDLFRRMRDGEFEDGAHVLRAKIDMAAANMKMRDPLLYRIRKAHHHRTGDAWCIYPMYDYAHCLEDAIEGVTHSLCTLEFENNRDIYDWVLDELGSFPQRPYQTEFARLEVSFMITSKRKLLSLVEDGTVSGWDDPRMPTLAGLRRRGYTPEAIRSFCERVGVAKANSVVDIQLLEHHIRDDLNHRAPRVMCVLRPLRVVIENYPEGADEQLEASYWPHDVPRTGARSVPFARELYIERDDFQQEPEKGFFRLAPGREVRLRYAYFITCVGVVEDPETGEVVELRCTYDPETRGGDAPDGRKVKGTLHWVSAAHAQPARVRLYDRLFAVESPGNDGTDLRSQLNPNSLETIEGAMIEPSVVEDDAGPHYQFERQGYFVRDAEDSVDGAPVFNRTVALRDSWAKSKKTPAKPIPPARSEGARPSERARPKKRSKAEARVAFLADHPGLAATEARYIEQLGIDAAYAEVLTSDEGLAAFFEAAVTEHGKPAVVAKWIANELLGELGSTPVTDLRFEGQAVGRLVALVEAKTISGKIAKTVLTEMIASGEEPATIVERLGLSQITDPEALRAVIDEVLAANAKQLAQYRGGNTRLFGFFVGAVMKATNGRAQPKLANELLRKALDED
jgi:glutaminyl-tRNA synthetase